MALFKIYMYVQTYIPPLGPIPTMQQTHYAS